MTREEAEKAYVDAVLTKGNPAYFILEAVHTYDDDDLIYELSKLGIDVGVIEKEE